MPEYTAKIKDSSVVAADPDKNSFSIEITPKSNLEKGIVRVSIPCGPGEVGKKTFLLKDQAARPEVTYRLPADSEVEMDLLSENPVPEARENCVAWELPSGGISFAAGTTMTIDVKRFGGNTPDGKADVIVELRAKGPVDKNPFTDQILQVDVSLKQGDEKGLKI